MDAHAVEQVLNACEDALAAGGSVDLRELRFWRAVAAVKRQPALAARYADRIGAIDRQAFERAVRFTLPLPVGTALFGSGALLGVALIGATLRLPSRLKGLAVLAGTGALLATTHDLAHLIVGQALGMRFSHWFLDAPKRVQPGLKLDYASYLRTAPRARAWMHAAGAIVTKVVPFAVLPVAKAMQAPTWTTLALLGIGGFQVATDMALSLQHSDWKRFRREMRVARDLEHQRV